MCPVSIGDAAVTEGNSGTKTLTFTVLKSGTGAANVNYATADGTATTASNDYAPTSGTLSFLAGDTAKTITVTVNGDTTCEPSETFVVNLSGATNLAAIGDSQGVGTIQNDE